MRMARVLLSVFSVFLIPFAVASEDCDQRLAEMHMPIRVKVSGKPKSANWGKVNKILGEHLIDSTRLQGCDVTFGDVFSPAREDAYFPILFNLLRLVPEESLQGAAVFTRDGTLLGSFNNVVIFEKRGARSYSRPYFQYRDPQGDLQAAGNPELIDISSRQPLFLLKWEDIRDKSVLPGQVGEQ